ncbi:MAG: hypothetical protein ACK2UW_23900 [Anaerolineales bacterium]
MRQRLFRVLVLLCFLLLLGVGAHGQEYQRPKPDDDLTPPTNADLTVYNGVSESITVLLLNLTPYDIEFHSWSITSHDEDEMTKDATDFNNIDRFMFVPVGIPRLIPGLPEEDFAPPDENYVDTNAHPYPMVFAFNDEPHSPTDPPANLDNWVKFTVKGVKYDGTDCRDCLSQDVQVGLWMYRNETPAQQTAEWLEYLATALKTTFTSVCLIVEAENPAAWIHEFLALGELGKSIGEWSESPENTRENDGRKMWLASYVIPNPNSLCVLKGQGCKPSTLTTTGDAVYSLWPDCWAGPSPDGEHCASSAAEANLVVEVGLLRGFAAENCGHSEDCNLGREPVVTITVLRTQDFVLGAIANPALDSSLSEEIPMGPKDKIRLFLLQAGAGSIRELLKKQGRQGLFVLRSVIQGLAPAQKLVLNEMIRTMGSGRLPTQEERRLVHLIAHELKKQLR